MPVSIFQNSEPPKMLFERNINSPSHDERTNPFETRSVYFIPKLLYLFLISESTLNFWYLSSDLSLTFFYSDITREDFASSSDDYLSDKAEIFSSGGTAPSQVNNAACKTRPT